MPPVMHQPPDTIVAPNPSSSIGAFLFSDRATYWIRVLMIGLMLGAFLFSRYFRLNNLPLFLDEALHINAGVSAALGDIFAGLEQGKWFATLAYAGWFLIAGDSIVAARSLAVLTGAATFGLLLRQWITAGRPGTAPWAALLYLVLPFCVFYDRVALTDQFLALLLALVIHWSGRALAHPGSPRWLAVLAILVAAPLVKLTGFMLLPVPLLIYLFYRRGNPGSRIRRSWGFGYALVAACSAGITMRMIAQTPVSRPRPPGGLSDWLEKVGQQVSQTLELWWIMYTPGMVVLLATAIVCVLVDARWRGDVALYLVLVLVAVGPFIFGLQNWYPRYLFPSVVPTCLLFEAFILSVQQTIQSDRLRRTMIPLAVALIGGPAILRSADYIRVSEKSSLPASVTSQYLSGWTAGTGLRELVDWLKEEPSLHPLNIVRLPLADQSLQGLNVYYPELRGRVHLHVTRGWSVEAVRGELLRLWSKERRLMLLLNDEYFVPTEILRRECLEHGLLLERVAFFPRPVSGRGLAVWEVTLDGESTGDSNH